MHFLALLLGESLEPPRDVAGEGYADFILTHECDRTEEIASALIRKAWADARYGARS